MAPLTIVHVLRAPMGGVMRHVRDLARTHTAEGHRVGIICDGSGTTGYNEDLLADLDKELELGIHRFSMSRSVGLGDWLVTRKISALVDALKPDVLHGHGAKGGVYARLCGSGKVARIYSPHGGSLHYDPKKPSGMIYFAVERWLEKKTSRILFVADYERRTYEEKIGAPSCPWTICYNGLGTDEFEPVPAADDAADFLFIGEMRALKGPDLFIGGIKKLIDKGEVGVSAIMVGAGPEKDQYRAMIEGFGLDGVISLRDPMPARKAFAKAKIVVLPSRAEAMPYIVIEALAAQKPVITTDVGGIGEIFDDRAEMLVTPERGAVETAMVSAFGDPDDWLAQMPDFTTLKARFSSAVMAQSVLNAYRHSL